MAFRPQRQRRSKCRPRPSIIILLVCILQSRLCTTISLPVWEKCVCSAPPLMPFQLSVRCTHTRRIVCAPIQFAATAVCIISSTYDDAEQNMLLMMMIVYNIMNNSVLLSAGMGLSFANRRANDELRNSQSQTIASCTMRMLVWMRNANGQRIDL